MSKIKNLKTHKQITESHCGPAVVKMLLGAIGVETTQEELTKNAGVVKTIDDFGMTPRELAKSVANTTKRAAFWYKEGSSIKEIAQILNTDHPVGVDWQGMFYAEGETESIKRFHKGDYGHYSVVKKVDFKKKELVIADPYTDFAHKDRRIPIDVFENRWFDMEESRYLPSWVGFGRRRTNRVIFLITKPDDDFPTKLDMERL